MTEHKTFPGKVYTVSCAEDTTVVLPDPLGVKEAVVLECTAGQQLHVTATAGRLETSSDQAIVTELFKLAPCRGVAAMMLLRKAGGWLPKGFTELEYLESSGTQKINVTGTFDRETGLWKDVQQELAAANYNFPYFSTGNQSVEGNWWVFPARKKAGSSSVAECYWFKTSFSFDNLQVGARFQSGMHWLGENTTFITENGTTKTKTLSSGLEFSSTQLRLIGGVDVKFFRIQVSRGDVVEMDFVPVLNAEGVPGMYDKKSKTFFGNQGTGTFGYRIKRTGETVAPMSLRDPWRVAPSGVYARVNGENALEILADTEETSGEGWEWFANTAEAYEHFGIVPQEEF